jgi:23S rRNA pseudouridine1911/1915/1917 synthase
MKLPDIIFENNDFVVLNKPSGMLSIPDRTQSEVSLKDMLIQRYGKILTVHRLDRDTSGIIVFAKNEATHQWLSKQFEERHTEKYYYGLLHGTLPAETGMIDAAISEHPADNGTMVINRKGKPSLTEYTVLDTFGIFSWVAFRIHTGRTHQIRIHSKYLGHPVACDALYGDGQPVYLSAIKKKFKLSKKEEAERPLLQRLGLHAWKLVFNDINGISHQYEAAIPKDLRALLSQLDKWKH